MCNSWPVLVNHLEKTAGYSNLTGIELRGLVEIFWNTLESISKATIVNQFKKCIVEFFPSKHKEIQI